MFSKEWPKGRDTLSQEKNILLLTFVIFKILFQFKLFKDKVCKKVKVRSQIIILEFIYPFVEC